MNEDYVVRYGGDNGIFSINRSDYMTKKDATKFYNSIKLDVSTTWKELLYEPLDISEKQEVIKRDEVRVVDFGMCKIPVPV